MKRFTFLSIVLLLAMIITPLISVKYSRVESANSTTQQSEEKGIIKVMSSENGFIKNVDLCEYLIGCVAGEMPASYHPEALKAQAVASYTYAKYISQRDEEKLGGADITDDSTVHQSYIDKTKRQEKWGDNFEKNEEIITEAVESVLYEYLEFNGKPAMTVYHNSNSGKTESAENVWGSNFKYLTSVLSPGDKLSPKYESKNELKTSELFEKLNVEKTKIEILKRFPSGLVETVKIGDKTFTGTDVREKLSLKSGDFDIEIDDEKTVIICRGNGHFVGMSQYSADFMARQGSTYDEILAHYYPETQLLSIKN